MRGSPILLRREWKDSLSTRDTVRPRMGIEPGPPGSKAKTNVLAFTCCLVFLLFADMPLTLSYSNRISNTENIISTGQIRSFVFPFVWLTMKVLVIFWWPHVTFNRARCYWRTGLLLKDLVLRAHQCVYNALKMPQITDVPSKYPTWIVFFALGCLFMSPLKSFCWCYLLVLHILQTWIKRQRPLFHARQPQQG